MTPAQPRIELAVPSSKSVTHRALLLAARSSVPCVVEEPLRGADCQATLWALAALGARFELSAAAVRFTPAPLSAPAAPLNCGNSGTSLRLLTALAATLDAPVTLTGDASLQARPNGPLLEALARQGARISAAEGRAPLTVHGPIRPGQIRLGPGVSSQYASGLALALAGLPGPSELLLAAPVASRPYLDLTARVAAAFGLRIALEDTPEGLRLSVPGNQRPAAARYRCEGDWSSAAFPLVAAAAFGRSLRLTGLDPHSAQGDRAVVDLIERFGPRLAWDGPTLCLDPAPLRPAGEVALGATPDLFPPLAALAALAPGRTTFTDAPSLRDKESDRIATMAAGLAALGVPVAPRPDGLQIDGGGPRRAAAVATAHDHRIYMAFAILGRLGPALTLDGAGCEAVSYPPFPAHLEALAGDP